MGILKNTYEKLRDGFAIGDCFCYEKDMENHKNHTYKILKIFKDTIEGESIFEHQDVDKAMEMESDLPYVNRKENEVSRGSPKKIWFLCETISSGALTMFWLEKGYFHKVGSNGNP